MDDQTRKAMRLWALAQPTVSAFITAVLRDFSDRDDVLQDVAVAVLDGFGSFDEHRPFTPWAIGVARNQGRPDRCRPPEGVDGALLFIRGSDRFVLVRRFGDGTAFVTGSDGTIGWAVPPRGRVHLSRDPRRFRRGMPGEREEVPFVDVRSGLDGLRRGYDLALTTAAEGRERLAAVRRKGRRRGPERVDVSFDTNGVATHILIEGLAVEDGMARSVRLDLHAQDELDSHFFSHEAHHAPDRDVEWE